MKYVFSLILIAYATTCLGQFSCDNIELLGIYKNNRNTDQLSLLLTNKSSADDGNSNVYTQLILINEGGDTILYSAPIYTLPGNRSDTIVYNLPIYGQFGSLWDLPDYNCGSLVTAFPECQISYCFDTIPAISLPPTNVLDCNDFSIAGLYETAIGGTRNYSFLLTNTNSDSLRNWAIGYTSFQFFDANDQPVSAITSPSFLVPMQDRDTIIVHMEFDRLVEPGEQLTLQMQSPDCEVSHQVNLISSIPESSFMGNLRIYPNPTNHFISIESVENIETIEILSVEGQLIQSGHERNIDISNLSPGVYVVRVSSKHASGIKRIVKF